MLALISDIHANLEALQAVQEDLASLPVRQVVCLGDVVGYGASPMECIAGIRARVTHWIRGNHEHGLLFYAQDFNPRARAALDWTRDRINKEPRAVRREIWNALDGTPEKVALTEEILLVHGSPVDPVREYILPRSVAEPERVAGWFRALGRQRICFLGHSHVPHVIFEDGSVFMPSSDVPRVETAGRRCLVNVGSVGQPRDGDPRSCYVTLEEGTRVTFRRVAYDVKSAMDRIRAVPELPDSLADRLELGR